MRLAWRVQAAAAALVVGSQLLRAVRRIHKWHCVVARNFIPFFFFGQFNAQEPLT